MLPFSEQKNNAIIATTRMMGRGATGLLFCTLSFCCSTTPMHHSQKPGNAATICLYSPIHLVYTNHLSPGSIQRVPAAPYFSVAGIKSIGSSRGLLRLCTRLGMSLFAAPETLNAYTVCVLRNRFSDPNILWKMTSKPASR